MTTESETTTPDVDDAEPNPNQQAAERTESNIAIMPPAREVNLAAIETLRDHVSAMRDAKFFAEGICYTSMVPERFRSKPGDGAAAILFGAELGLSPIASLRSVIVIHGMPGLEARTMKALLQAKGYHFRTAEKTNEAVTVHAWEPQHDPRTEDPDVTARWTIEDAVQAGYVPQIDKKTGKYQTNSNGKLQGNMKYIETPRVMLMAKSTAEACREIAPHILLGMPYAAEELETEWDDSADEDTARPARKPRGMSRLKERAAAAQAEREANTVDAEVVDAEPEGDPRSAPDQPPAETSPAPPTGNDTPAPAEPTAEDVPVAMTEDDIEVTPAQRSAALDMLNGLLINAGLPIPSRAADRRVVIADLIGHAYPEGAALTNRELKAAVDGLRAKKLEGGKALEHYVGDVLDTAAIEAARDAEGGDK